ncbi:MAG: 2-phosphosulfolactate phosphatase [Anaerolineaceae bacterium]
MDPSAQHITAVPHYLLIDHAVAVTRSIDIARLPADALEMGAECYVVVDVLRATTTIATLFAWGMEGLLVAGNIELARTRARAENRLLFGEVHGLRPEGFDFGNSPVEAAKAAVAGCGGALFTTNGTAAFCALAGRGTVISGALANLNSVAPFVRQFERVVVVCAGNSQGTVFSEEDFAAAGAIVGRLAALEPTVNVGDQATVASALDAVTEISNAPHAELLRTLGLGADVEFCMRADTSQAVPLVVDSGAGWALLRESSRHLA